MKVLQQAVIQSSYDIRDYRICAASNFPDEFICEYPISVKNQGAKPTCVAHAISSLIEYHYYKTTKQTRLFSTEFIYGIRELGYYMGDGMCIRDALATARNYGDPFRVDCPGNNDVDAAIKNIKADIDKYKELAYPHRISAYYKCVSPAEIMTALMTHGPVVASMNTYNNVSLIDDVYIPDESSSYGRHCILIIGWNTQGWIIHNSWGKTYAGDGRFTLPFEIDLNETWGVTDEIIDDTIKTPSKFIIFISALVNKIINFFNSFKK